MSSVPSGPRQDGGGDRTQTLSIGVAHAIHYEYNTLLLSLRGGVSDTKSNFNLSPQVQMCSMGFGEGFIKLKSNKQLVYTKNLKFPEEPPSIHPTPLLITQRFVFINQELTYVV